MDENSDLFGNPVRPGFGKRGRPPFVPSERDRSKVKLLLASGWANERIARTLGIHLKTLKRYFIPELKEREAMRDRLTARMLEIAMDQANAGNIGALKQLDRLLEKNDRMEAERAMGSAPSTDKPQAERVGKKVTDAQRAIDADADLMAELEREAEEGNGAAVH